VADFNCLTSSYYYRRLVQLSKALSDFLKKHKMKINYNLGLEEKCKLGKLFYNYKDVSPRHFRNENIEAEVTMTF